MGIAVTVYIRLFFVAFFIKHAYSSKSNFPSATIRVRSGILKGFYIEEDHFCDIFYDSSSAIDIIGENVACYISDSGVQTIYHCDDQRKNVTVLCNTVKDCQDGSDELNCGDEVNVKNCTGEDKYLCKDGLRCLDLEDTCNNRCNCFDCSDENSNCTKNDFALLDKCRHAYFVTASGPKCLCNSSSNASSSALCHRITECVLGRKREMRCDQHCIQFGRKSQCLCYDGFHPEEGIDGMKCVRRNGTYIVELSSQSDKIISWNKTTQQSSTIVSGISNCTLLTAANDYVYFVTSSRNGTSTIFKASLHSGKLKKLIEIGFYINSIAVDYIADNVYFTGNGSLSVCTGDGRICKQLKCCGISSVAVAPHSGFMFYTIKGPVAVESSIDEEVALMRSYLDGSNETACPHEIFRGNVSIEMDESAQLLFLLHSSKKRIRLHRISIESGSDHFGVVDLSKVLKRYEMVNRRMNDLCITMAAKHYAHIFQASLDLLHLCAFEGSGKLTDMHIYKYNEAIQRSGKSPCNKSACSGLCLLKRDINSETDFLSYTCICDGFTPNDDNHWCKDGVAYGAHYGGLWIAATIVSVLIILGVAGGWVFRKRSWFWYYLTLRMWVLSRRDQEMVVVEDRHQ